MDILNSVKKKMDESGDKREKDAVEDKREKILLRKKLFIAE